MRPVETRACRWRRVGCAVARVGVRKDTGKLFFDFQWGGKRRREQTALDDTPQNRKRADQVLRALSVDIDRGDFDYSKYF